MRKLAAVVLSLALVAAAAEPEGTPPPKGKVYALVAAMGDRFMATHEVVRTGSHLPPFRRNAINAPDNVLNRLVLSGLDDAVAKMEPASKRVYVAVSVPRARTESAPMDQAALDAIVLQLRAMPERAGWDRIVAATPAYRTLGVDAMAATSQGFGVFMQPLCQSQQGPCGMYGDGSSAVTAEKVVTPDGREIRANQFVAPYVFLKVWILDPQTLAVTDSQEVFEYQKMWDPKEVKDAPK